MGRLNVDCWRAATAAHRPPGRPEQTPCKHAAPRGRISWPTLPPLLTTRPAGGSNNGRPAPRRPPLFRKTRTPGRRWPQPRAKQRLSTVATLPSHLPLSTPSSTSGAGRLPLRPAVTATTRVFLNAEPIGPSPRNSVNRALPRAARKARWPTFTTYHVRHSFAAGLRRARMDAAWTRAARDDHDRRTFGAGETVGGARPATPDRRDQLTLVGRHARAARRGP